MKVISDTQVLRMMKSHGGSFFKALGEAGLYADAENLAKLKAAFPEDWKEYALMAEWKQRGEEGNEP